MIEDLETAPDNLILESDDRLVAKEFSRQNLGNVRPHTWLNDGGDEWKTKLIDYFHHAGTTRMGNHPSQGVVDSTLEVFDVAGLYVCGGSVFPTSGYANPTLSIVALAYRLADHLRTGLAIRGLIRVSSSQAAADQPPFGGLSVDPLIRE